MNLNPEFNFHIFDFSRPFEITENKMWKSEVSKKNEENI